MVTFIGIFSLRINYKVVKYSKIYLTMGKK